MSGFPSGPPASRIPNGELFTESVRGERKGPSGERECRYQRRESRDIKKEAGRGDGERRRTVYRPKTSDGGGATC